MWSINESLFGVGEDPEDDLAVWMGVALANSFQSDNGSFTRDQLDEIIRGPLENMRETGMGATASDGLPGDGWSNMVECTLGYETC